MPAALRGTPRRAKLNGLAGRLGDEHGLSVLRSHLRRLIRKGEFVVGEDAATSILGWIVLRRDELRAEVIPLGERIFAEKGDPVEPRIIPWWAAAKGELRAVQLAA